MLVSLSKLKPCVAVLHLRNGSPSAAYSLAQHQRDYKSLVLSCEILVRPLTLFFFRKCHARHSHIQGMLWNGKWYGMEGEFWYGIWKMLRRKWNGRFEKWNGRSSSILPYLLNSELHILKLITNRKLNVMRLPICKKRQQDYLRKLQHLA